MTLGPSQPPTPSCILCIDVLGSQFFMIIIMMASLMRVSSFMSEPRLFLGGHSRGLGAGVGNERAETCGVVRPLRTPMVIFPLFRTYVVVVR